MSFLKNLVPDFIRNEANKIKMKISETIYPPSEQDVFQNTGHLCPDEFKRAGQKLIEVCTSWQWKKSLNPKHFCPHFDPDRQFLALEKVKCRKRIHQMLCELDEKVVSQGGEQVIVLNSQFKEEEPFRPQDMRYYNMYIVYDEGHHVPRMYFNGFNFDMVPLTPDQIKEDIQKQYIDKTLTFELFPFMEGVHMATVHPCKHANVLKTMADSMIEGGQIVESHFALLIFIKFITSVIPTIEFDFTGDLIFE